MPHKLKFKNSFLSFIAVLSFFAINLLSNQTFASNIQYKMTVPIQANLRLHEGSFSSTNPVVMKATVKSTQNLDGAEIIWVIPEGIKLIEGQASTRVRKFPANQAKNFFITVGASDLENRQLFFIIKWARGDSKISKVVIYNTIDQEKIDKAKEKLSERLGGGSN